MADPSIADDGAQRKRQDRAASVYLVTNLANGRRYVGVANDVEQRRISHIQAAMRGSKYALHRAIRKHGIDQFLWAVLSVHPNRATALAGEIAAIAELRPEYNSTRGGEGIVGCPRTTEWLAKTSAALKGRTVAPHGLARMLAMIRDGLNNKPVTCLNDGRTFDSAKAAAEHYGIPKNRISIVLSGKEISVKGFFFWRGEGRLTELQRLEKLQELVARKTSKWDRAGVKRGNPVMCVETQIIYASSREAARQMKIPVASAAIQIASVARGEQKHIRGYTFRLVDKSQS